MARQWIQIMEDESALDTLSTELGPVEVSNNVEVTYYIVGGPGVASGAVQIEEAHVSRYAGTWAPNGAAITVAADTVKTVKVSGISEIQRARISTVLAGGTVSIWALVGGR